MRYRLLKVLVVLGMLNIFLVGLYGCNKLQNTKDSTEAAMQANANEMADVNHTTDITTVEETEPYNEYEMILTNNNSWESDGMICSQYDGLIKNQSGEAGKDWKVVITVPENSKLENGWNGTYNLKGTSLEITPADYNEEIMADTEITFGFILHTKSAFFPENVVLDINNNRYVMSGKAVADVEKQENMTEELTAEEIIVNKDAFGTPVEVHGTLSVVDTDIVDKEGNVFQLKGVSTHGINWFPDYVNKDAFMDLAQYGVNAIRLAMYTADYNGYCSGGNQIELENLIDKGVQACTDLGLYVIVDWHILNDNDPNQNIDTSKIFFDRMSKKYAEYDNVIYEICNEPNGGTSWEHIKSYAEEIIPIIRKNDENAIIIVGTPNWSQDVDVASRNPIVGQSNIIYAAHFYASTHKGEIRDKIEVARNNGLPVIISECSICEASGDGSINYDEAARWMKLIEEYQLSFFAWNLSNKDEQSSFIKSTVTKTSEFVKEDFSEVGNWFLEQFGK